MTISPYFRNLRSAYFAELDDLLSDSEGANVLAKRLADRRKEVNFLVSMMEVSPEMVAVVFHKAFRFKSAAAMDELVSHEPEDLPEWETLAESIDIAPWAVSLMTTIRKQPMGDWFLCVAAGLEYLFNKPDASLAPAPADDADSDDNEDGERDVNADAQDEEEEREARAREEAGADWMVEQGFDRKD